MADPMLFYYFAGFFFLMGLLWGSFFNVCVYRQPAGQSIYMPGSYCYHCGSPVRWYDNLPVLGYLILGGRCRDCRSPFSMRYAIVEFLTGLLFLAVFLEYGVCWALPVYLIFTGLLLISSLTDIDHWIILDRISLGGGAAGLVFALVLPLLPPDPYFPLKLTWLPLMSGPFTGNHWWVSFLNALAGALAGSGLLWAIGVVGALIFRKPAMGFGDVKLLVLIGAFLGWKLALMTIFLASFLGSVWGIGVILLDKLAQRRASSNGAAALTFDEARELLADDSEAAKSRGWAYSEGEKRLLARLLTTPPDAPASRRHLPFGPHLAAAAWILMVFGPEVLKAIRNYLAPVMDF